MAIHPICRIAKAIRLRRASMILYRFFGLQLSPIVAEAPMSPSSVPAIGNALRQRKVRL
jgi:hypothetical protein